jgi:chromosome segregation ATPase
MSDEKGTKTKLEDGSKALKDVEGKLDESRNALDDSVKKVTSPFEQKKEEFNAIMNKAEEPFNSIKLKQQQAQNAMEEAKNKAEAAKKILNAKEILHEESKKRTDKALSGAKSRAENAKSNIENAQRDLQKADELVKSLIAKLESKAGGKI